MVTHNSLDSGDGGVGGGGANLLRDGNLRKVDETILPSREKVKVEEEAGERGREGEGEAQGKNS